MQPKLVEVKLKRIVSLSTFALPIFAEEENELPSVELTLCSLCFFSVFLVHSDRKQCAISAWCQSVKTQYLFYCFGTNIGLLVLIWPQMTHKSKAGETISHIVPISATVMAAMPFSRANTRSRLLDSRVNMTPIWRRSSFILFGKLNNFFERT